MKKTILLICGLLLFIPCIIFADMGAPAMEEYKATIINPDGAVLYEGDFGNYKATNKKLEYGKTTIVGFEYGEYAELLEPYGVAVKLADIELVQKDYTFKDSEWSSLFGSVVLKDQVIRKGPASAYESTGVTIPAGTKVNLRTKTGGAINSPWGYVEYNGTKGYINSYDAGFTFGELETTMMPYEDVKLTDANTGKVIKTIKANTKLKGKIYDLNAYTYAYYIETENEKGLVEKNIAFVSSDKVKFTAQKNLVVYDSLTSNKKVTTLSKGTTFKSKMIDQYNSGMIIYYENGNDKGWINAGYDDIDYSGFGERTFDNKVYTEAELNPTTPEVVEPTPDPTTPEVIEPTPDPISPNQNQEQTKREIPYERLFMGVVVALILCITALITVILVNRKKK